MCISMYMYIYIYTHRHVYGCLHILVIIWIVEQNRIEDKRIEHLVIQAI